MIKAIFKRVMWLARGTSMVLGLAVMLALMLGVATVALAAVPGDPFKLGKTNTINALSSLVGSRAGALLKIDNNSTSTSATALQLETESGVAPMKVNRDTKVTNLNADKLDGMNPGELPGSVASTTTINNFPGFNFDLGTAGVWKFLGDPETGITTTSSQRLVGSASVPMRDPDTSARITYDLCYRPSGGGTLTPFSGSDTSTADLSPTTDVIFTATSSVVPGAGTWDVGFCVNPTDSERDVDNVSYVNGWVQVVNE